MRRPGFTLIELLVVIAIVAILAGILYPVIAKGREKARQIACASQLKQIGTAVTMYVDDYDGVMPIPRLSGARGTWAALVEPYIKGWKLYHCPNMKEATLAGQTIWNAPLNVTGNLSVWQGYGWNADFLAPARADCSDFDKQFVGSGPPASSVQITNPSETVMITGISLEAGPGSWANRSTFYPERGGYFMAPAPASVGTRDTCTASNGGWGAGSYLGPFGGFECNRHGGVGNVLFVDGRVKAMRPDQLAAGTNWTPETPIGSVIITDRTKYLWDLD